MAALPRRVIIDDADPQIQYSGIDQWTLIMGGSTVGDPNGPNGPPFQNTTRLTKDVSSLSLRFRGSQPQVFGTGAHYECFVNDTSIGSTPEGIFTSLNNLILCDGAQLFEAKEYTLTLNVTQRGLMGFYFDYITYILSTSDPLGSATVLVDRSDADILYQGVWDPGPLPGQLNQLGNPTATPVNIGNFAHASGSNLTFNFNGASTHYIPASTLIYLVVGTSVTWVGFIPAQMASNQSTSNAIYSIDRAEPVSFSFHSSTQNLTNQVFFTSPTLNPGLHSLKVTHQGNATTPPLVLDHFIVANNVATPSLQVPPVASASPQPPAMSSTVATTSASANKLGTSVPIGAIIGGAVGGIAVFCLAAVLLRRRIRHRRFVTNHDNTATPHLMPFDATSSGRTVAKAGDRTLKVHRSPVVDPPELNAAPQAEIFNQGDRLLRTPPAEAVHEDRSARSVTDGVADPPPSYVSQ
ncbi:hypothetical protein BD779DRAFT_1676044 [Infundibulicybe gibba]|nr:hypothetical protein BD779DRAFT_1676044 [Infundibulicybe gibba]